MDIQTEILSVLLDTLCRGNLISADICEKSKNALPSQKNLSAFFAENDMSISQQNDRSS